MSTDGIEASRRSSGPYREVGMDQPRLRVHTGGPTEFDLLIDTLKQEMKEAVLVAMVDDRRPLEELYLQTCKVMTNPRDTTHEAVIRLTVGFRKKDRPNG
jgi:hypothetical protein